jgi:hypothetical protein
MRLSPGSCVATVDLFSEVLYITVEMAMSYWKLAALKEQNRNTAVGSLSEKSKAFLKSSRLANTTLEDHRHNF